MVQNYKKKDIINDIQKLEIKLNRKISRDLYRKYGKYTTYEIEKIFGTFSNILYHVEKNKLQSNKSFQTNHPDQKIVNQYKQKIKNEIYKISKGEIHRIDKINRSGLFFNLNLDQDQLFKKYGIDYDEICNEIKTEYNQFIKLDSVEFNKNKKYIIVGDFHGSMVNIDFIKSIETFIKENSDFYIIHLGHFFDEYGNIHEYLYRSEIINRLIIIYREDEVNYLLKLKKDNIFENIKLLNEIKLKKLIITNQTFVSEYSKEHNLSQLIKFFDRNVITNSHTHTFLSFNTIDDFHIISSPGCGCNPHVKHCVYKNGLMNKFKNIKKDHRYNRQLNICRSIWNNGLIILYLDGDNFHIQHSRFDNDVKCFVYNGKAYTKDGIKKCNKRIICTSDWHCPHIDKFAFDILMKMAKDINPNIIILNGDIVDFSCVNHFDLDKNNFMNLEGKRLGYELNIANEYLDYLSKIKCKKVFIQGNHERFLQDFLNKYPMLSDILNLKRLLNFDKRNIESLGLGDYYKIDGAKIIHGDVVKSLNNSYGSGLKKIKSVYGNNTMMGDIHHPMIVDNVYACGLIGNKNQKYIGNTPISWIHGFGIIEIYNNKPFLSLIHIIETENSKEVIYGNKKYKNNLK